MFKEFSIDEYLLEDFDELITDGIDSSIVYQKLRTDWKEFKSFCNERNGKRCIND